LGTEFDHDRLNRQRVRFSIDVRVFCVLHALISNFFFTVCEDDSASELSGSNIVDYRGKRVSDERSHFRYELAMLTTLPPDWINEHCSATCLPQADALLRS
jgi:hypothetical protein